MHVTKAIDTTRNFFIFFPSELLFILTPPWLIQNINRYLQNLAQALHFLYYSANALE